MLSRNFNISHVSINRYRQNDIMSTLHNFNTSHVSINRYDTVYGFCTVRISIHLMFLLIPWWGRKGYYGFNISIHLMFLLILIATTVHYRWTFYFNTSHVSINLRAKSKRRRLRWYFNTSHVSINPGRAGESPADQQISIHLMFLLIGTTAGADAVTCGISIHLMFLLIVSEDERMKYFARFQYISCFY